MKYIAACACIRCVMKADTELANAKPEVKCWKNDVCKALRSLPGGQELADCVKGRKKT